MITLPSYHKNRRGGFTLVELLIVVLIIGALLALALPIYEKTVRDAKEGAIRADLRSIFTAGQIVKVRTGFYPSGMADPNFIQEFKNSNPPAGVTYSYTPPSGSANGVIAATEAGDVFGSTATGEKLNYTFAANASAGDFSITP